MGDEDPFEAALAALEPPRAAGGAAARADASAGVGLVLGLVALLAGTALAVLLLLDALPADWRVAVAGAGYALTPAAVMGTRVVVHLRVLRAQRAAATVTRATEDRLRRLHRAAVASLVVAVPHVWVLAQAANLWWDAR